jgi:hypothetical protein
MPGISNQAKSNLSNLIAAFMMFLFVYTATSKFLNLPALRAVLIKSKFPGVVADFGSIVIPSVEIIIALLLFVPFSRRFGFIASTVLMLLFTLYIVVMMLSLPELPCSCGDVIQSMTWTQHLIFNVIVTLISYLGFCFYQNSTQELKILLQ